MIWIVYILQCGDGTFYTGITNDLERRLAAHGAGKAARYTRGRGPVTLVYSERRRSKSHALKREIEIKKMNRIAKLKLVFG